MNIVKTVPQWKVEHKQNEKFLSTVLDKIFAISKQDDSFSIKNKNVKLDGEIKRLISKCNKQKSLLEKANQIETDINKKITDIEEQNFSMKSRLLEILGSES